jgi:hypothetical protein
MFLVVYLIAKYYDMFVFVTIQQSVLSSDWLNYWFDTSTNQSISIMFSIVVLIDRNGNANHFSYEELGNNCI